MGVGKKRETKAVPLRATSTLASVCQPTASVRDGAASKTRTSISATGPSAAGNAHGGVAPDRREDRQAGVADGRHRDCQAMLQTILSIYAIVETMNSCALCDSVGGELLWRDEMCRVIRVGGAEGAAFPGFCRVVWHAHVAEMSELTTEERQHLIAVVLATETAVREIMHPDKINLASLGNVVPHLHWHVIPRWYDDSHFPAPIWAAASRSVPERTQPSNAALTAALLRALEGRR